MIKSLLLLATLSLAVSLPKDDLVPSAIVSLFLFRACPMSPSTRVTSMPISLAGRYTTSSFRQKWILMPHPSLSGSTEGLDVPVSSVLSSRSDPISSVIVTNWVMHSIKTTTVGTRFRIFCSWSHPQLLAFRQTRTNLTLGLMKKQPKMRLLP